MKRYNQRLANNFMQQCSIIKIKTVIIWDEQLWKARHFFLQKKHHMTWSGQGICVSLISVQLMMLLVIDATTFTMIKAYYNEVHKTCDLAPSRLSDFFGPVG